MNQFLKTILHKISFSSMLFWDIRLHYTPERIFDEKIAATLYYKNKLNGKEHTIDLDVEKYQWYIDDKALWEEYYFDSLKIEKQA